MSSVVNAPCDYIGVFKIVTSPNKVRVGSGRLPLRCDTEVDQPGYMITLLPFEAAVAVGTWQMCLVRIQAEATSEWGLGERVNLYMGSTHIGVCIVLEPINLPGTGKPDRWDYRGKWPEAGEILD